jgi:hypothetical protein
VLEAGSFPGSFPASRPDSGAQGRRGRYDLSYARAIAKLGEDGWELVTEASSGAGCGEGCRVLYFKRFVANR